MSRGFFQPLSAAREPDDLEAQARHAGLALACTFSSSAEFDAALIAERRAAGVYGPKRQRRQWLATGAGLAAGLAVIVLTIGAIF